MNPQVLLIIGPTAVGKSSLLERALRDFPQLVDIVTYTTRPMRAGEEEGRPYHFVTEEKFKELVSGDFFVEWAHVHGKMYGTPRDQIKRAGSEGRPVIIDIDVQGAKALMREFRDVVTVFLIPPSVDALRQRFVKRGITSDEDLERRLQSAQVEMSQASYFDHVLINDNFELTYVLLRKIVENLLKNQ